MTYPELSKKDPKIVRDTLREAVTTIKQLPQMEAQLISQLSEIDKQKFYIHFGYKSLKGFCIHSLKIPRTQAQRIVTAVRRLESISLERCADVQLREIDRYCGMNREKDSFCGA